MSVFKPVNPKILLGTGIIVFFIGLALWIGKWYETASLVYMLAGFSVIVWAVAMKRKKLVVK